MLLNDVRNYALETMRGLDRWQREVQRLFGEPERGGVAGPYPPVNVWVGKERVEVLAELPGVDPEAIDLSIVENRLTLKGKLGSEPLGEGDIVHRRERLHGAFERSLELPVKLDPGRVEARYERGLLRVTVERAEEDKPRHIKVKSA